MKSILIEKNYIDDLSNVERKKYLQKVKLLKYIYREGPKSTAELYSFLNISSPTVLILINELLEEGLLEKRGRGKSIGGRKPELYALRDRALFVLSISLERFKIKMAILDNNNNNITGVKSFPLSITRDISIVDKLLDFADQLIASSGINKDDLVGVGVNMPGLVNAQAGENYTYLIPELSSETLQQIMEAKFNKPVYIQNDVKSAALAEFKFGKALGKKNVLVLLMDWGIGLGIIMDGKLQSGTSGFSGEFGHIPFVDDGNLCYCGKRGCLETVASGIALARMAKEGIRSGQNSILNEQFDKDIDKIEPYLIIDAANHGDQYAINILSDIGANIGKGIAILIQLFNPELIILGGKMAEAKQYITIPIQHAVNTYCMTTIREKTSIALSQLGQDAGILGSSIAVMEDAFEKQILLAGP